MRIIFIMLGLLSMQTLNAENYDVYLGTYTRNSNSKGIYHAKFDSKTGKLSAPELAAEISSPSFIAIHPDGKHLYAVTEARPGKVSSFAINPKTGGLTFLNQVPAGGDVSCHVSLTGDGKTLFVANYGNGSIASIPVNNDGSLGKPASIIQHQGAKPHAHSVNVDPSNRFVYAADLGIDKIMIYRLNPENSKLTTNDPASFKLKTGSGPRHFTFHPNGKFAYVINERDNTLTAMAFDPKTGGLTEIETLSTLPTDFKGKSYTAELRIHPNGKFLYGSNREHDSIVVFKINPDNGRLSLVGFQEEGINWPRHFNIDPSGKFCLVANQKSDDIEVFAIDPESGMLKAPSQKITIGKPVCIKFLP